VIKIKKKKVKILALLCLFGVFSFFTTASATIGVFVGEIYEFHGTMEYGSAGDAQLLEWDTKINITAIDELTITYNEELSNIVETENASSGASEYNITDQQCLIYDDDTMTNNSIYRISLTSGYHVNTYFIYKDFTPKIGETSGFDLFLKNYTLKVIYDSNGVLESYKWTDTLFPRNTTIERTNIEENIWENISAYPPVIIVVVIIIVLPLICKKVKLSHRYFQ